MDTATLHAYLLERTAVDELTGVVHPQPDGHPVRHRVDHEAWEPIGLIERMILGPAALID